jgi:hypothetical protein
VAKPSQHRIVAALLERHGLTYAEEFGIKLQRGTPSVLFRWLCASTLLSARIGAGAAMHAARALAEQGWTTAEKMAAATWEQRTRTLNQAGYARYDESTSRMLGDTALMLLDKYRGDLRQLRVPPGAIPSASGCCSRNARASARSAPTSSAARPRSLGTSCSRSPTSGRSRRRAVKL